MVVVNDESEGTRSSINEIAKSKEEELKMLMIRLYKQIMYPIIHVDRFEDVIVGSTSSIDELANVIAAKEAEMESMIRIYKETICPMIYAEINAKNQNFLSVIGEKLGVNLLTGTPWNFGNTASTSGSKVYQLKFINGISSPVSTKDHIIGKDNKPFVLALVDVISGEIVSSSMEVELVVLKVDCDDTEARDWTCDEFNSKIVTEWNGTKVLQGKTFVTLKDGFFDIDEVSFTHNSRWKGIRKWRVGARPVNADLCATVKEAITEPVIVTDKRNLMYKKHKNPSLLDHVYRLYMISSRSECFKRLSKANINTVMDLLTINAINPKRLKEILDVRPHVWKVIIDHAQTCKDDKKGIYLYHHPNDGQKSNGVVFNMFGQLVGLITESHLITCDKLPYDKRADAHELILSSSEHWDKVVSFNDLASLINHFPPNTTTNSFPNSLNVEIPHSIVTTPMFPITGYDHIGQSQSQSESPKRPASEHATIISPKKPRDVHFSTSPTTPGVGNSTGLFKECRKPNNLLTPATSRDDEWSQFFNFSQYVIPVQRWKMVWCVVGWISIFSKVRKRRQYLFLQTQSCVHVQSQVF